MRTASAVAAMLSVVLATGCKNQASSGEVTPSAAQPVQPIAASKPGSGTRAEAFTSTKGAVIITGYTEVGTVTDLGKVVVEAREFRTAANPSTVQYGVAINVHDGSSLHRVSTSVIDEDEIDSLVDGLAYISKVDHKSISFDRFHATYRTRGDLSVSAFSDESDGVRVAVSSGGIGAVSVFLKPPELAKFRQYVLDAKSLIEAAKQKR